MTDGTMAIPVSPVTEEDMGKVRHLFDQALNALVGMSQLSKDVDALRSQVGDLTNTVNRYRSQIDTLDEALYRTRQERDEARNAVSTANHRASEAEHARYEAEQSLDQLRQDNVSLNERLVVARRESDDHMMRALEAEEKLAAANKKLEEVREHFKSLFPEVPKAPEPVAVVSTPYAPIAPTPEAQPENVVSIPVVHDPVPDKPWWEKDMELNTPAPHTA